MPVFRVVGVAHIHFVHEIEAKNQAEAEAKGQGLSTDEMDYQESDVEKLIHTVIELDDDGKEIEDEDE